MEDEAELGSDDEERDDVRKKINREGADENEEGLDADLDGFVVHGNDDDDIGSADDEMRDKFLADIKADEREEQMRIFKSVILGNNRKRKRGDVELDDEDDFSKRKRERIEARQ